MSKGDADWAEKIAAQDRKLEQALRELHVAVSLAVEGHTQEDLARRLGKNQSTISRWAREGRKIRAASQ